MEIVYPILRLIISILKGILGCFLTILVSFGFAVAFIFVAAYKYAVTFFLSKRSSEYGRILAPMDMLMWEEFPSDCGGFVPHSSLVVVVELDGGFQSCGDVAELFGRDVVPFYPELSMRIERVFGFLAFKRYAGFSVSDHFCEVSGDFGLGGVHAELLNRGFSAERSPWEVVLFNGGKVLGFRIHHCVADGLSVLKMFVERLGGKTLVKSEKRKVDWSFQWCGRVLSGFGIDFFECAWYSLFGGGGEGEFRVRGKGSSKRKRNVVGTCHVGSFENVQIVGRSFGVRASSVVIAGILGGLKKFTDKEMGAVKNGKLNRLRFGYVLPVSGHPSTLCNHWRTTYSTINLGEISNTPSTQQSLKQFDKVFLDMKQGSLSVLLKYSIMLAGSLVSWLGPVMLKNRACGVAITNIAGDDEGFSAGGRECIGYSLSSGGLSGIGIMFVCMTYKRKINVCCVADERILSWREVEVLAQCIDREFKEIFKGATFDFV